MDSVYSTVHYSVEAGLQTDFAINVSIGHIKGIEHEYEYERT